MKRKRIVFGLLVTGLALTLIIGLAAAQGPDPAAGSETDLAPVRALGTTFTYQGRLTDGGSPANGHYDFKFQLYDAVSGGHLVGGTVDRDDVGISEGLFTVRLDFGADAFTGEARWLSIGVRPGSSSGAYTTLSPRQALTPAPTNFPA